MRLPRILVLIICYLAGLSWSSSATCPLGDYPLPQNSTLRNGSVIRTAGVIVNTRGYDDSWSSTQLWRSIGNITSLINASFVSSTAQLSPLSMQRAAAEAAARRPAFATGDSPIAGEDLGGGACYAYCPPMMGFGVCFTMPPGTPPGNCSTIQDR